MPWASLAFLVVAALGVSRAAGPITVDGALDDAGWRDVPAVALPFETEPGDNVPAGQPTSVRLARDDRYLYVAWTCLDSDAPAIRAPHVDRDAIGPDDDSVTLLLDTRGDGGSALALTIDARGQQADGVWDDARNSEDRALDVFFDSAARIDGDGWRGELRIPFTSLRYQPDAERPWRVLFRRNYPRGYHRTFASVALPRNAGCLVCHAAALTPPRPLPAGGHVVVVPYASASRDDDGRVQAGADVKWTPTRAVALDATVNPDFSQLETDAAQIAVNRAFALFTPEKRPFFLEGTDLLATPIQAVWTRSITAPRWGLRATGRTGASSWVGLVAADRGGGSVIVPGPTHSVLVPQDFESQVAIVRARRDLGRSFAGVLGTLRDGGAKGGVSGVAGADGQWSPGPRDRLFGQLLWSDSRATAGRALYLQALHDDRRWHLRLIHSDVTDGFRAEVGYVPQVGYRLEKAVAAYNVYDLGAFTRVEVGGFAQVSRLPDGALLQQQPGFFVSPSGILDLGGEIDLVLAQVDRVGTRTVRSPVAVSLWDLGVSPGRTLSRVSVSGTIGDMPDLDGGRAAHGGDLTLKATVHAGPHLQLDVSEARQWLDDAALGTPLSRAHIERVRAGCNLTSRAFARAVVESEHSQTGAGDHGRLSVSLVAGFRLDWQTVAFAGWGDERVLTDGHMAPTGRSLFLKVSYALQR